MILYVMGAGRSGSTVLGAAIGEVPTAFMAGELDAYWTRCGEPNNLAPPALELWAEIRRAVEPAPDEARYWRQFEHPSALVGRHFWSAKARARYRARNGRLLEEIKRSSGAAVVVDTSHYPLRYLSMGGPWWLGEPCFLVHLVRDPRDVVASFQKPAQKQKGVVTANIYLLFVMVLSWVAWVRAPEDRRIKVRFEDVLENPIAELARVLSAAGLHGEPRISDISTELLFQGNRLKDGGRFDIEPRPHATPSGRPQLRARLIRLVTAAVQMPVLLRYRYLSR